MISIQWLLNKRIYVKLVTSCALKLSADYNASSSSGLCTRRAETRPFRPQIGAGGTTERIVLERYGVLASRNYVGQGIILADVRGCSSSDSASEKIINSHLHSGCQTVEAQKFTKMSLQGISPGDYESCRSHNELGLQQGKNISGRLSFTDCDQITHQVI